MLVIKKGLSGGNELKLKIGLIWRIVIAIGLAVGLGLIYTRN